MKEYNIYFSYNSKTEYNDIIDLIKQYTANFSIIEVIGYYGGIVEHSKCLKIVDVDNFLYDDIENMIESMKILGNQESILLTITELKGKLI